MPQIEVHTNGIEFDFDGGVKQYPYRTASARDRFMEMRRDSEEFRGMLDDLEIELAKAAGKSRDNHTVYEVTTSGGSHLYIMFHDFYVFFGLSVEERRW